MQMRESTNTIAHLIEVDGDTPRAMIQHKNRAVRIASVSGSTAQQMSETNPVIYVRDPIPENLGRISWNGSALLVY